MKTFITATLAAFIVWVSPIYGLILSISILVGVDTFYAIYATIKLHGRQQFRSHKLFNIVPKTFLYMGSIIFAYMVDTFFFEGKINDIPFAITKLITAAWCIIEVKSIDETRLKLGHKSIIEGLRNYYKSIKKVKKDLEEL